VVTLLLSVVTAGLLVAPAAVHRFTFQRGLKTVLLGHRMFTVGLARLALTLAGGVMVVLDVAVGSWFAVPVALASLLLLLCCRCRCRCRCRCHCRCSSSGTLAADPEQGGCRPVNAAWRRGGRSR
jgi:Family of unknown function (DUF6328)